MEIDLIVTEANAFEAAELIVMTPGSTKEQIEAAAAVLAQSPIWTQRILGREVRAGLYALPGAELKTKAAIDHAPKPESVQRYLDQFPDMHQVDWPAYPDFVPDFSKWKQDAALIIGFTLAFAAVVRWWTL